MLVSLFLLVVLAWHFYLGYSRGLVKQAYYGLATLLSLFLAGQFYQPLADRLTLWVPYSQALGDIDLFHFAEVNAFEMDRVFYAGLAYLVVFAISLGLLVFLGIFLHLFPIRRWDNRQTNVLSGCLSVLVSLVVISLLLNLLATIPFARIQQLLMTNALLKGLLNFPLLAQHLKTLWVTAILG